MDIESMVPLDEGSLLETAQANTGLSDFGDEDWREPFQILVDSIARESELNLMGRIMSRSDLLLTLQARLQIEDTLKKHPEILEQEIRKPLFVIGQGRSGTSMLQDILSKDPDNGVLTNWEVYFPCPPPETASYHTDPRIKKAHHLATQVYRVTPEFEAMHAFGGDVPTENIELHCVSFKSPSFNVYGGQVPTYMAYLQQQDMVPVYEYEKKVLKILQWKNPRKHWVFKSPYSLAHLSEILSVYPDVGFIWNHRDPVKALSSMVDLIGTLFWGRSDHPFRGNTLDMLTNADINAMVMSEPIELLESGRLPREQLCNIQFHEFISDPMAAVRTIYDYFSIELTKSASEAIQAYIAQNPRARRPAHHYATGAEELVDDERKAYARYQQYFNVPNEL